MSRCVSCDADLQVKLVSAGRYAIYVCTNPKCQYSKRGVPRSDDTYMKRVPKG